MSAQADDTKGTGLSAGRPQPCCKATHPWPEHLACLRTRGSAWARGVARQNAAAQRRAGGSVRRKAVVHRIGHLDRILHHPGPRRAAHTATWPPPRAFCACVEARPNRARSRCPAPASRRSMSPLPAPGAAQFFATYKLRLHYNTKTSGPTCTRPCRLRQQLVSSRAQCGCAGKVYLQIAVARSGNNENNKTFYRSCCSHCNGPTVGDLIDLPPLLHECG